MKQQYSKYKPSGVEWIGEIPEHWGVSKVKWELIFLNNRRRPLEAEEREKKKGDYPYYGASGIIDYVDQFIFEGANILVGEDGANILSRSSPLAFIARGQYWVNNHAHILSCPGGLLEYFCHQLELNDFTTLASGSAQPKLTKESLSNIFLIIPPLPEQEEIVKYLDQKTGEIDNLISITEGKIELLKENRTALINRVITKGLDPNVEMKDSGVEWIGEIPEHWEVIKLKHVGLINSGDSLQSELIEDEGEYPVYGGNGVLGYYSKYNFNKPILSIGRVGEKCGVVHYVSEKVWINDNSLVLEILNNERFEVKYLFYCLLVRNLNLLRNQNTQPLITGTLVKNEYIPNVSLPEQEQIVKYLDQKTGEIDNLISIEQQRIETLKEYRQSLISEVITGKVRVCEKVKM